MAENKWGDCEHFHHPLDRENWHLGGFQGSHKVYTMGCTGRVGNFHLLWVIIRLFLLFETPQKLVSASFIDTMATEKSDTANKTNIKRDKSRMQSIIQTSHNTCATSPALNSSLKRTTSQPNGFYAVTGHRGPQTAACSSSRQCQHNVLETSS